MRTSIRTGIAAVALLVPLTGCGLDSGGDDSATSAGSAAQGEADPSGAVVDSGGAPDAKSGGGSGAAVTRGRPAATDRAIAYVGEVRVEVGDVTSATASAITQVTGAGGSLAAQQSSLDESANAALTFKVPPAQFPRLLTSLGRLGRALGQTVTSEDVTEQLVDLEARLRTAKASADRVRALLSRAGSITEIVNLEREVAAREAEVESMEARLRSLDGRVEEATLTLLLTADGGSLVDDDRGFVTGLGTGWDAFVASAVVVATVAGAVLPFAAVAALVAVGVIAVRRRRGAADAAPTA